MNLPQQATQLPVVNKVGMALRAVPNFFCLIVPVSQRSRQKHLGRLGEPSLPCFGTPLTRRHILAGTF